MPRSPDIQEGDFVVLWRLSYSPNPDMMTSTTKKTIAILAISLFVSAVAGLLYYLDYIPKPTDENAANNSSQNHLIPDQTAEFSSPTANETLFVGKRMQIIVKHDKDELYTRVEFYDHNKTRIQRLSTDSGTHLLEHLVWPLNIQFNFAPLIRTRPYEQIIVHSDELLPTGAGILSKAAIYDLNEDGILTEIFSLITAYDKPCDDPGAADPEAVNRDNMIQDDCSVSWQAHYRVDSDAVPPRITVVYKLNAEPETTVSLVWNGKIFVDPDGKFDKLMAQIHP